MATNQVVPFAQSQLPAYFTGAPEDSNIVAKEAIPSLSFRGKVWRLVPKDGEEMTIMNKDNEPAPTVSVVVLDYVKPRSRVFYEGQYVAGENKAPNCSSLDGIKPDASIAEPVAKTCATCPNAVKGSKITPAGKASTLCGQTRRIAIVPVSQPESDPYLLRIAPTSIWDRDNKEGEAAGWYAWEQYTAMLAGKGCTNSAQVVTKIKFDHRAEYPKLLFSASRWLTPEEWAIMQTKWKAPSVKSLLQGVGTLVDPDAPEGADDEGMVVAPAAPVAAAPAAPAPARAPRAPRAAAPAAAPVAAAPVVEDDDEGIVVAPKAAPAAAAPQAVPTAPATANAGLSSLLSGWDD